MEQNVKKKEKKRKITKKFFTEKKKIFKAQGGLGCPRQVVPLTCVGLSIPKARSVKDTTHRKSKWHFGIIGSLPEAFTVLHLYLKRFTEKKESHSDALLRHELQMQVIPGSSNPPSLNQCPLCHLLSL